MELIISLKDRLQQLFCKHTQRSALSCISQGIKDKEGYWYISYECVNCKFAQGEWIEEPKHYQAERAKGDNLERHIGEVLVRFEDRNHYDVKVRINNFEDRTEANLKVSKDKLKTLGITGSMQTKISLPLLKKFILQEINEQYPEFWTVDY